MVRVVERVVARADVDAKVARVANASVDCAVGSIAVVVDCLIDIFIDVDGPMGYVAVVCCGGDCDVKVTAVHGETVVMGYGMLEIDRR